MRKTIFETLVGVAVLVVAAGCVQPSSATNALTKGAVDVVQELGDDTIAVLTTQNMSAEERRKRLEELLDRGIAIDTMGRFALGRYWRTLTPDQQSEYLELYRQFVVAVAAASLEVYAGETFEILKALPIDDKNTMVNTMIYQPDRPPIRVDYRVRRRQDSYKIVEIRVEGITTDRSEFVSIIIHDGIEGLMEFLRERISGTSSSI